MSDLAEVEYNFEKHYFNTKMKTIERLLVERQDAKQQETPQYWTHVETLRKINADLDEIIDFMSH